MDDNRDDLINDPPEAPLYMAADELPGIEKPDTGDNENENNAADTNVKVKKRCRCASGIEMYWQRFYNSKFGKILYEKGILYFLISFFVSAGIMLYAFKKNDMHPYGDRQMLVVDLWHQYYPFFRVVREKLVTGGSFMYSWQNGLGTNFLSLIAYYAASPLNWISVFFDSAHVRDAMMFILCAKIGFAGAFFSSFLRYTYKRKDCSICVFSVMYALSSYTLGYYWNVMWFDTIALFPLVMLGVVAICREHKWKTYTFALALSLISNYYVGLFTCIFTVFMFAAWSIIEINGKLGLGTVKKWSYSLWLMIRSSVIGIALGGFILLPAYFGLQLTHSAKNEFPKLTVYYEPWNKIIRNLLSYSEPAKVEGLPNFACGMLAIVLAGVFLISIGIKMREKLAAIGMLVLIVVSCNMNKLNYIWHGFHFTNQIPYRFAFIFSFILASAAYRAYDIMLKRGIKVYQIIAMFAAPIYIFALNGLFKGRSVSELLTRSGYHVTEPMKKSLMITGAFILIFVAAKVFPFKHKAVRNTFMSFALAGAVFSEFISNANIGVKTVGSTQYDAYPSKYEAVREVLDETAENDPSLFYRTEMTETYTLNDSALYGFRGLSQFSSAANEAVTVFVKRMGLYGSEAGNRYYYRTSSPVTNGFFGIKYIVKRSGYINVDSWTLERCDNVSESDSVHIYRNKYPLSLGFMVNEDILQLEDKDGLNPFEYQNELLKKATGINENCFLAQMPTYAEYDNDKITVNKNGFGNYTFRVPGSDTQAMMTYHYKTEEGVHLYGYASANDNSCEDIVIRQGSNISDSGKLIQNRYAISFPVGDASDADKASVEIRAKQGTYSGNYKLMVYGLMEDTFTKLYNALADEQLELTSFKDNEFVGTVNAYSDGILYLAMPYEKGWRAYIDGEKAETVCVCNAMMGVKVPEGEHEIRMVYYPEGFVTGVAATTAGIILTGFLIYFENRRRRRRALAAEKNKAEYSDDVPYIDDEPLIFPAPDIYNQDGEQEEKFAPKEGDNADEKPESDNSLSGD